MDTTVYCGRRVTASEGSYFIVSDIVGNGRTFWAENLEAAQRSAAVRGHNPAKVMEAPQVDARLEEMYA